MIATMLFQLGLTVSVGVVIGIIILEWHEKGVINNWKDGWWDI